MNALTIIIPYANYHANSVMDAIASAEAQTVPCDVIVIADPDSNGAGYTRNRGIEQCQTAFCTFLDADDVLDPHFAEICLDALAHYAQSHTAPRYVYTDWIGAHNARQIAPAPCVAWTEKTFHLVTAVVPTARARLIGGFDEAMAGVEDADFYVRLRLSGICGIHVEAPLVSYREGGQRSIQARQSGAEIAAQEYMIQRYGGYTMGCCGDTTQTPITPGNEPQDGYVLAQAQWNGNRIERGRATGTLYPRTSHPHLMYIDPRDIDAAPHLWKRITSPLQASNGVVLQPAYKANDSDWTAIAGAVFGGGQPQPVLNQPIEYKPHRTQVSKKAAAEWVDIKGSLD